MSWSVFGSRGGVRRGGPWSVLIMLLLLSGVGCSESSQTSNLPSTTPLPTDAQSSEPALPHQATTTSQLSTMSSTSTPGVGRGQANVDDLLEIAEQALGALGAEDVGWAETHGDTTSYVNAIFDLDGANSELWVVVGSGISDLLGYFGPSYSPYDAYEPSEIIETEIGTIEGYVLPPTSAVPREIRLARIVGVCTRYQVALDTFEGPLPTEYLQSAVEAITCS